MLFSFLKPVMLPRDTNCVRRLHDYLFAMHVAVAMQNEGFCNRRNVDETFTCLEIEQKEKQVNVEMLQDFEFRMSTTHVSKRAIWRTKIIEIRL